MVLPLILNPPGKPCSAFHITCSAKMLNRHGERLHPWRTPFLTWNHTDRWLAVLTAVCCILYRFRSNWTSCGGKLISSTVLQSWSCCTMSKALRSRWSRSTLSDFFLLPSPDWSKVANLITCSFSWPKSSLFLSYLAFKFDLHSVQNHPHRYLAGVCDQCNAPVVVAL